VTPIPASRCLTGKYIQLVQLDTERRPMSIRRLLVLAYALLMVHGTGIAAALMAVEDGGDQVRAASNPSYTEEVEVTATAAGSTLPTSSPSVVVVDKATIEKVSDYNLAKTFSYSAGTYVSSGSKNETSLQIRGLSSSKVALLYDGIPVYEPYFGSFDLNSFVAEEVESVKLLKGTTSVLYGPNVMGGAVNVLTRRPDPRSATATTSYGSFDDFGAAATGTATSGPFGFLGSFTHHRVDDFSYQDASGEERTRANSDYETTNLTGKFYYSPSESSELMAELGYVTSEYGMPWATERYRHRYWRFPDWDRYLANVGGTFPLSDRGYLKARGYYVKHHNVLDAFTNESLEDLSWRSTFDNSSYGAFLLGSVLLDDRNELKFSANLKSDHAETQDDIGEPWERFSQQTLSFGAEDHLDLNDRWALMGGVSIDHLNKQEGNNKTAVNPLVGVRFSPSEAVNLSATFSRKSRFPTLKDLYSSSAGNPDLREERGNNLELGFDYQGPVGLTGAVFYNRFRDLIQSIRNPDGFRVPSNVGGARIAGFELGCRKKTDSWLLSGNYTYLNSKDLDTDLQLPLVPASQVNLMVDYLPRPDWKLSFWGTGALGISTRLDEETLDIPDYFVANAGVAKTFDIFELSLRTENLLNASYVTEPGYPMPARSWRVALRVSYGRR
jgi:iron complex outermembrane receptor protein